jgi:hypothetical protein
LVDGVHVFLGAEQRYRLPNLDTANTAPVTEADQGAGLQPQTSQTPAGGLTIPEDVFSEERCGDLPTSLDPHMSFGPDSHAGNVIVDR